MKYFKAGILVLLLCIISGIQSGTVYGREYNGFYYYVYGEGETLYVSIDAYYGSEENLVIPEELEGYPVTSVEMWYSDDEGEDNTTTKSITIPAGVAEFSVRGFTALTDIFVDERNETYQSIDGILYSKDGTKLVQCPVGRTGRFEMREGTVTVDGRAFSPQMTELYIPESFNDVEMLPWAIRWTCEDLEKIQVSDKNPVLHAEDDILYNKDGTILLGCPNGKKGSINIPENVEVISEWAFSGCSKIENVSMPDTVNSVGESAFYGCSSLTDIHLSANITSLGTRVFDGCMLLNRLVIPSKLVSVSAKAFTNSGIREFVVEEGNESISFADGILYGEKGKLLIKCLPDVAGEISLQEGVVSIEEEAFYYCLNITKVTFPDSVTEMGQSAFYGCQSLMEIHLSRNLTNIPYGAFEECYSLEEIIIPESVTEIENFAFDGCINLKKVWIESMKVTNLGYFVFGFSGNTVQVYVYDENLYQMFMEDEAKSYGANITLLKKTEPLELSKYNVTLYTGNIKKSATIKAVLTDIKGTVKWTTSNKSVATVKNGKITAVKKGKAVITAKVGKYKKTVQVTVKNPDIVVADGSESIKTITLKKGSTVYYRVSVNPKGSKVKTEVGKNISKMAKISLKNNTLSVKGLKKGTCTFKLKCGQGSKKITVKIK
ncbi:MAG: leucine-rich repeat protein [Lachnospiraceae bacterium]|nr:leucine-rich repeat protein [Lachnospiraceae bacterium]